MEKKRVNIVWMPKPNLPEDFFVRAKACKTEAEGLAFLCEAHEKGWIEILGQTQQSKEDIAACLQEFYKVQVIKNDGPDSDR